MRYSRQKRQELQTVAPEQQLPLQSANTVSVDEQKAKLQEHELLLASLRKEIKSTTTVLDSIDRLKQIEKPLKARLKVLAKSLEELESIQVAINETGLTVTPGEFLPTFNGHSDIDVDSVVSILNEMSTAATKNSPHLEDFV